ncbi:MAG: hypothetical protein Ct9H300mP11_32920 [Chloroflexota bacterium]|nr:MAG: hypothetical protein Ct9H300mP11_32920 [Chloroflexota bacterium]
MPLQEYCKEPVPLLGFGLLKKTRGQLHLTDFPLGLPAANGDGGPLIQDWPPTSCEVLTPTCRDTLALRGLRV